MAHRGENLSLNMAPDGNHVGFYAKLTETVYKEMTHNPEADDWTITFDQSLKRAVIKSSASQYDVTVVDVNKDERFFALQKDSETKTLDAVAPVTSKLTVENTLTKSSIMSFAEKTDTERKKGIQSSKISDDVKSKKGNIKDQKSVFRSSSAFTKSIRRTNEPAHPPPSQHSPPSRTQSSTATPSANSSTTPPAESGTNPSPPANGSGTETTKKEFKFRIPTKRKAETTEQTEQPAKKQKVGDDGPTNGPTNGNSNNFGFLSKFSEMANRVQFSDPERDRPPRRPPAASFEQFELFQNEYSEKYNLYVQLFKLLE